MLQTYQNLLLTTFKLKALSSLKTEELYSNCVQAISEQEGQETLFVKENATLVHAWLYPFCAPVHLSSNSSPYICPSCLLIMNEHCTITIDLVT